MTTGKRDFDKQAAQWDDNPVRVRMARDVAEAIRRTAAPGPETDALDFGCGTGLLALNLQPHVRSVTGADNSAGMLEVFARKAADQGLGNVRTLKIDLDSDAALPGTFHLIASCMTLHHLRDTAGLLARLYECAAPGGWLCVADLDLEGGLFHGDNTGVHHFGFDRDLLRGQLEAAGFADTRAETASEIVKPTATGESRRFPVFLISGRKR